MLHRFFKGILTTIRRTGDAWWFGLRVVFSHPFIALGTAAALAMMTAPVDAWIAHTLSGTPPHQEDLIKVALSWSGVALVAEILLGPIFAGIAVYLAWSKDRQRPVSIYKAVNFALGRYRRMFLPHLGAQLSIQIGMLVLVPGILFMCMYAFVDPVAALEDEKWPMARSKKLTQGLRKTIMWVSLPLIALSMVRLMSDMEALSRGPAWFFADYAAAYLLQFWLWAAYTRLYLKRTTPRAAAQG